MSNRVGNVKKYKVTFTDEDGVVAPPENVRLELTPPGATTPTVYPAGTPQLEAVSPAGTYVVRFRLEVPGQYKADVWGDSAALSAVTAHDGVHVTATLE